MAKNQPSYLALESTHIGELHALAQRGSGFFHICGSEVPSIIPKGLRQTWDSAVVINSATAGSMAIIGHRIDQNAVKMDHHPFVIRFSGLMPYGEGVLIDHAAFPGRSVQLPSSSVPKNYYRDHPPFGLSSGSTGQLPGSLYQAFDIAQRALGSTSPS